MVLFFPWAVSQWKINSFICSQLLPPLSLRSITAHNHFAHLILFHILRRWLFSVFLHVGRRVSFSITIADRIHVLKLFIFFCSLLPFLSHYKNITVHRRTFFKTSVGVFISRSKAWQITRSDLLVLGVVPTDLVHKVIAAEPPKTRVPKYNQASLFDKLWATADVTRQLIDRRDRCHRKHSYPNPFSSSFCCSLKAFRFLTFRFFWIEQVDVYCCSSGSPKLTIR